MTKPNLDALAKLGPFTYESDHELFTSRDGAIVVDEVDIAAALNEWVELRAYRERIERGKQSLREWILAVNSEAGCAGADWMQADKMRLAFDELGLSDPAPKENTNDN